MNSLWIFTYVVRFISQLSRTIYNFYTLKYVHLLITKQIKFKPTNMKQYFDFSLFFWGMWEESTTHLTAYHFVSFEK